MTSKPAGDKRNGALGAACRARRSKASADSCRIASATRAALSEAMSSKKPLMRLSESLAFHRELPQSLEPRLRPAAVQSGARRIDRGLNGCCAGGDEQGKTTLQHERRRVRTAI